MSASLVMVLRGKCTPAVGLDGLLSQPRCSQVLCGGVAVEERTRKTIRSRASVRRMGKGTPTESEADTILEVRAGKIGVAVTIVR